MKHQIFTDLKLILIENKGKFSLCRIENSAEDESAQPKLLPVEFIPEQSNRIIVYPECRLIVTDATVFSLDGRTIAHCSYKNVDIFHKLGNHVILITDSCNKKCGQLILWDGSQVILDIEYQQYIEDDHYFAVYLQNQWQIYDWQGCLCKMSDPIVGEDICLKGYFLIENGIGNHELYSLKRGLRLRQKQNVVLCSSHDDFAVCADLSHKLEIYCRGEWHYLDNVSFFGLIDDLKLFYVQINGKYYLYHYHTLQPVLNDTFPQGFDFVSYDPQSQTFLIRSGKRTSVLSKRKALGTR